MLNFYDFISERQRIELKKAMGTPKPWTTAPILRDCRFTNIDRNHDRGTIKLIEKAGGLRPADRVFFAVMYRSAYSSLTLLKNCPQTRRRFLRWLKTAEVRLPGRRPYQLYLKAGQTLEGFLKDTATPVADFLNCLLKGQSNASISDLADRLADEFRRYHGKRLIFLATEIIKDLTILLPGKIDPNSPCPMNVGARRGLRYFGRGNTERKIAEVQQQTGLNFSTIEHAFCEWAKYVEYSEYFVENEGHLKARWRYRPSPVPLMTFNQAVQLVA